MCPYSEQYFNNALAYFAVPVNFSRKMFMKLGLYHKKIMAAINSLNLRQSKVTDSYKRTSLFYQAIRYNHNF
jgi:hypothetical protein